MARIWSSKLGLFVSGKIRQNNDHHHAQEIDSSRSMVLQLISIVYYEFYDLQDL